MKSRYIINSSYRQLKCVVYHGWEYMIDRPTEVSCPLG